MNLKKMLSWSFPRAEKDIGEFSKRERNYFLAGMFGQNIIYGLVGSYLSVFYTDVIGVHTVALIFITVVTRIWDGINDIIMGTFVDKTHTRWGKCRPYLKFIPVPIGICTILLFMPIAAFPAWLKLSYVIISWLLWETLYTLCDIPLWGMTSLITPDEEKRSKLISYARIIGSFSAAIVIAFEPIVNIFAQFELGLFPHTGKPGFEGYYSAQQGFFLGVAALTIISTVLFKLVFPNVRERVKQAEEHKDTNFKENLKIMFANKPFIRVVASIVLGSAKGMVLSAGLYFCKWVLSDGGDFFIWLIVLGGSFMAGTLISMGTCTAIGKKFGKKRVLILSCYLSIIPYLIVFLYFLFNGYDTIWPVAILMAVSGFLTGFSNVYPTTMIADSIDYMEHKTGKRLDGVFFSGLNFSAKLSSAVMMGINFTVLSIVNYTPQINALSERIKLGETVNFAAEYPGITLGLLILITLIPAASCVLQALPLHGYILTEDKLNKILSDLESRREKAK